VATGKVLDLNRQDTHIVVQWSRNHSRTQLWDIEDAGNGYVVVKSAENHLALDIDGGRARDGARVLVTTPNGGDSQLWKIAGGGSEVRFTSRLNIALDLPHSAAGEGTEYQVWSVAGQNNQRFRLVWLGTTPAIQVTPSYVPMPDNISDEKRAYQQGNCMGIDDFRGHPRRTYARHRGQYNAQFEVAFIEGYYDGYDASRPDTSFMGEDEKESYDEAYRSGQRDYREGKDPNYMRYSDRFPPRFEIFFRRGYSDGYYSAR
jgi:Ricin-type beta-trefoil lectin domain-like